MFYCIFVSLLHLVQGRCTSWGWHRRFDTGEMIRVVCEKERHDKEFHTRWGDRW